MLSSLSDSLIQSVMKYNGSTAYQTPSSGQWNGRFSASDAGKENDSDHCGPVGSLPRTDTLCRKIEGPEKAMMRHHVDLTEGSPDECELGW